MAVNIFLKLGNGIKGESQNDQHKDWIDILSWSVGMTQSGTTHLGSGGGGGKVDVGDIAFTKYVDASSHDLIKRCCSGEHISDAELHVLKAGGSKPVDYMKIKMKDVMITSYNTGGMNDGLDRIQESLTLNFRMFEITYTKQNQKGAPDGEFSAGWEIAEDKEWSA
ncbi:MAG: Hcp family type VI secretion system effector [Sagittula sp.]|jgi:type VI secretion system secreted protein Hcp|uniref:Hcp family type VI secretion system effector n=1 Tax=unclassified Sagittula TaxID=2624628 RepID=UPI000C2D56B0|nr:MULTISPECIES: type VI secretion system tube protein Hcp [unclassified Sagittula]AUC56128.1 Hcp1 family type VI secretion system effector [Sagittula sp. P11]WHZ37986.1 type VI secretion system tube protein Hcp [Sagittula sp. MA-2]